MQDELETRLWQILTKGHFEDDCITRQGRREEARLHEGGGGKRGARRGRVRQGRSCVISMQRSLDRGSKLRRRRRAGEKGSLHRTWHKRQTNNRAVKIRQCKKGGEVKRGEREKNRTTHGVARFETFCINRLQRRRGRQAETVGGGGGGEREGLSVPKKRHSFISRLALSPPEPQNEVEPKLLMLGAGQ